MGGVAQERAYDQSQKYKEGKYILERARMVKDGWRSSECFFWKFIIGMFLPPKIEEAHNHKDIGQLELAAD